ncbi:hypothetical protein BJX68DRAFT_243056 [Aspergillus pseudodeflectus]|uniref:Uncharacterized protein n=1 Tax=Aspergillus pseudodeflectus TaxID=176178 RepID=A0ABR4JXE6_9EURO
MSPVSSRLRRVRSSSDSLVPTSTRTRPGVGYYDQVERLLSLTVAVCSFDPISSKLHHHRTLANSLQSGCSDSDGQVNDPSPDVLETEHVHPCSDSSSNDHDAGNDADIDTDPNSEPDCDCDSDSDNKDKDNHKDEDVAVSESNPNPSPSSDNTAAISVAPNNDDNVCTVRVRVEPNGPAVLIPVNDFRALEEERLERDEYIRRIMLYPLPSEDHVTSRTGDSDGDGDGNSDSNRIVTPDSSCQGTPITFGHLPPRDNAPCRLSAPTCPGNEVTGHFVKATQIRRLCRLQQTLLYSKRIWIDGAWLRSSRDASDALYYGDDLGPGRDWGPYWGHGSAAGY